MQHVGELIVSDTQQTTGQVTGTTHFRSVGVPVARRQLAGGLTIEAGGHAIVHGQVARNVVNHGTLELLGPVAGKVIGNPPTESVTDSPQKLRQVEKHYKPNARAKGGYDHG